MKVTLFIYHHAGRYYCQTTVNHHLIIMDGVIPTAAESKVIRLIKKEYGAPTSIVYEYDIRTYLTRHDDLSLKAISDQAGINHALMRQYANGQKTPSEKRTKLIQDAIRSIGRRLTKTTLK